jgi:hypothetical protein
VAWACRRRTSGRQRAGRGAVSGTKGAGEHGFRAGADRRRLAIAPTWVWITTGVWSGPTKAWLAELKCEEDGRRRARKPRQFRPRRRPAGGQWTGRDAHQEGFRWTAGDGRRRAWKILAAAVQRRTGGIRRAGAGLRHRHDRR